MIPACAGHLLVQATLLLPAFILAEATLSYIGLGFPDPVASWGTMLAGAGNYNAVARFPWTLAPAVAIFFVVLVTNLLIVARRDADTDPFADAQVRRNLHAARHAVCTPMAARCARASRATSTNT